MRDFSFEYFRNKKKKIEMLPHIKKERAEESPIKKSERVTIHCSCHMQASGFQFQCGDVKGKRKQ